MRQQRPLSPAMRIVTTAAKNSPRRRCDILKRCWDAPRRRYCPSICSRRRTEEDGGNIVRLLRMISLVGSQSHIPRKERRTAGCSRRSLGRSHCRAFLWRCGRRSIPIPCTVSFATLYFVLECRVVCCFFSSFVAMCIMFRHHSVSEHIGPRHDRERHNIGV